MFSEREIITVFDVSCQVVGVSRLQSEHPLIASIY